VINAHQVQETFRQPGDKGKEEDMAKLRFTVVISGSSGYRTYQVKANDWKEADKIAIDLHRSEEPEEPEYEIGTAAVIAGWPKVW